MNFGPLAFATPGLLLALIGLPILWLLLRAIPPAPIRRRFPAVALMLGLTGCATEYHRSGLTGGFSETRLAPDLYRVYFAGNGFSTDERTQDFALLRAAAGL